MTATPPPGIYRESFSDNTIVVHPDGSSTLHRYDESTHHRNAEKTAILFSGPRADEATPDTRQPAPKLTAPVVVDRGRSNVPRYDVHTTRPRTTLDDLTVDEHAAQLDDDRFGPQDADL